MAKYLSIPAITAIIVWVVPSALGAIENRPPEETFVTGTVVRHGDGGNALISAWHITRDEIDAVGYSSAVDLLRLAPGVTVSQQGIEGDLSFVSIRGGDPNFTKILIDGIDVDNPTNSRGGGFDFSMIDPSIISRIDVFYGAYSALLGSSGLAGVINVVTKAARETGGGVVRLMAGTDGQRGQTISVAGALSKGIGGSLSIANRIGIEKNDREPLKSHLITFKLQSLNSDKFDFTFGGYYSDTVSTVFPEDSGGERLAVLRETESRDLSQKNGYLKLRYQNRPAWQSDIVLSHTVAYEKSNNPGIAAGVLDGIPQLINRTEYARSAIEIVSSADLFGDRIRLGFGASYSRENAKSDGTIIIGGPLDAGYELRRNTRSVFGELQSRIGALNLLVGLRSDRTDEVAEETARVLLAYEFEALRTKFSISHAEGFKLPSIFALAHPLVGNSNLRPELSSTSEIRFDSSIAPNKLSMTFLIFRSEFERLIDFDPILFTNFNRSSLRIDGAELQVEYLPSDSLRFSAALTYITVDLSAGETPLRRRPDWTGNWNIAWQIRDSLSIRVTQLARSAFNDSSIPTGIVRADGYVRSDAVFQWQPNPAARIDFAMENMFDSDYEEAVGFSNPGRQLRVVLTYEFP